MRKIFSGLLVFMLLFSCTQCMAASGEQNYDNNEETDKKQNEGGDDSVGNSDKKTGEQDEDVGSNEKNNGPNEDNRDKESGSDVKDKDKEKDCENSADEGDNTPEDDEEERDIPEDDEEECGTEGNEEECDIPENDEEDECNEDSENNIDESEEDENKENDDKDYEKEFDKNIDIQDEKGGSGTGTAVVTKAFMQVEASPDQVLDDSNDLSTKTMNEYVKVSAQPIENSSERKGGIIYQGLSILSVLIFCIFISILSTYWKIK